MNGAGTIKKSEMNERNTYLLCPDRTCKLFFDPKKNYCESDCPNESGLVKIIQCINCKEPIELPGNHNRLSSVSHACSDGYRPLMFQRMSGKYCLIYERPK